MNMQMSVCLLVRCLFFMSMQCLIGLKRLALVYGSVKKVDFIYRAFYIKFHGLVNFIVSL